MEDESQFGLNEQDLKDQKVKTIFLTVRNFFEKIGPTVVRLVNVTLYYIIKLIRSIVVSAIRMVMGKEV